MRFNIEVPVPVYFIIQELEKCGHEAYMVGGCVREFYKQVAAFEKIGENL